MLKNSTNFIFLCLPLIVATLGTYQGEDCTLLDPNSPTRNGTCMEIDECDYAKKMIQRKQKPDLCQPQKGSTRRLACCPMIPSKKGDNCVIFGHIRRSTYYPNIAGKCTTLEECGTAKSILKFRKMIDSCFLNDNLVCCPLEKYPPLQYRADELCADFYKVNVGFFEMAGYGGEFALPREFPHMVAVGYKKNNSITWFCGGSVISEYFVLTAAHCTNFHGRPPNLVRLGDLDLDDTTEINPPPVDITITEIYRHPDYKFSSHYHDIALLRVESEIWLFFFKPVCLHNRKDDIPFQLEATGWGETENSLRSSHLLKISLNLTEYNVCAPRFLSVSKRKLKNGIIDELQICAGGSGHDTCGGDSGGPLHYVLPGNVLTGKRHFVLAGVTSFGKGCGELGVYTRVSPYISWIDSIVWPPEVTEQTTENPFIQNKVDKKCDEYYKMREEIDQGPAHNDSTIAVPKEFPHLAVVGYRNERNITRWVCWGNTISEYFIISSARWTRDGLRDANIVRLGDLFSLDNSKNAIPLEIGITKIYRHPNYRSSAGYHDIALLKVEHSINLHIFRPICLHTRKEIPFELESVGWLVENSIQYKGLSLNLTDTSVCDSKFPKGTPTARLKKGVISKLQICGIGVAEDMKGAKLSCESYNFYNHGNYGGPVHYKVPSNVSIGRAHFVLAGIGSFGEVCGKIGVYTRISPYVSWIDSIVWPSKVTDKVTTNFLGTTLTNSTDQISFELPNVNRSGSVVQFEGDYCIFQNGKDDLSQNGTCTNIQNCNHAKQLLRKTLKPQLCGFSGRDPLVCCPNKID